MIHINNKEISDIHIDGKKITTWYSWVNHKVTIIWEAIKSCFGYGMWINKKPWLNKEAWRNGRK